MYWELLHVRNSQKLRNILLFLVGEQEKQLKAHTYWAIPVHLNVMTCYLHFVGDFPEVCTIFLTFISQKI